MTDTIESLRADLNAALSFIRAQGYDRCDVGACNCGSWHGGHSAARLGEIRDALVDAGVEQNGVTILGGVRALVQERDVATARAEKAEMLRDGAKAWAEQCRETEAKQRARAEKAEARVSGFETAPLHLVTPILRGRAETAEARAEAAEGREAALREAIVDPPVPHTDEDHDPACSLCAVLRDTESAAARWKAGVRAEALADAADALTGTDTGVVWLRDRAAAERGET